MRIQGKTYEEIAQQGGGILNSARKLGLASEDELFESVFERLYEVIRLGTGAIEIKSGYGLTTENELKMLRVIKRLKEVSPIEIKSTFLGAHAYPMEYKQNHQGYIDKIINEMLPVIKEEELADYIDVFCERGFFSVEESKKIIEEGYNNGLKAKIHGNQMGLTGGVQLATEMNCVSIDHLEHVGEVEIELLLNSSTIPTLLPTSAFFLNNEYPPARKMIDSGLGVVLASDYNPGTTPSGNMNFVNSLACITMKMTPNETIIASTINGARAIELEKSVGSIAVGKKANFIVTERINSLDYLPYRFGNSCIRKVYINGKLFK
jgi:imidazolonepropionase